MNKNIMSAAIIGICLGMVSIANVWADEVLELLEVEFDCIEVTNNAESNVDFECIPKENDIEFQPLDIINLKLDLGINRRDVTIALNYPEYENRGHYCLSTPSVNLNQLESSVIVACEWNNKSVIVSLNDDTDTRRRGRTARCWSRRSHPSTAWRCHWRSWDCNPIDIE